MDKNLIISAMQLEWRLAEKNEPKINGNLIVHIIILLSSGQNNTPY